MVQDDPLDGGGPVLPTGLYVDMLEDVRDMLTGYADETCIWSNWLPSVVWRAHEYGYPLARCGDCGGKGQVKTPCDFCGGERVLTVDCACPNCDGEHNCEDCASKPDMQECPACRGNCVVRVCVGEQAA